VDQLLCRDRRTGQGQDLVVKQAAEVVLANLAGFLIDLDGVIYRGQEPLPGATTLLSFLSDTGMPYRLVTNNSRLLATQYVQRLASMGMEVETEAIVTAGQAAVTYLTRVAQPGARVFVIGEEGIVRPLLEAGYQLDDEEPEWVVVGLDIHVTYQRLQRAMRALDRGAGFIGTNPDLRYPIETEFAPGCGALLALLEAATGRSAHVVGKPNKTMVEVALDKLGLEPGSVAIIGDSLATDIAAGRAAGITTILLLTGVTTAEESSLIQGTPEAPTYVFKDLPTMLTALQNARRADALPPPDIHRTQTLADR